MVALIDSQSLDTRHLDRVWELAERPGAEAEREVAHSLLTSLVNTSPRQPSAAALVLDRIERALLSEMQGISPQLQRKRPETAWLGVSFPLPLMSSHHLLSAAPFPLQS